jgi:hypothetical protein
MVDEVSMPYRVKRPPADKNLRHTIQSYFLKVHFNSALSSTPKHSKWFLEYKFSYSNFVYTYLIYPESSSLHPIRLNKTSPGDAAS